VNFWLNIFFKPCTHFPQRPAGFRFFVKGLMVGDDVKVEFSVGHPVDEFFVAL